MAAPVYVIRRVLGCDTLGVADAINTLVADGYEFVQVYAHGSTPPSPAHEGRTCLIDVIGVRK